MISNEQLICDHKNKNLQKCVLVTSQRECEILDQFEAQIKSVHCCLPAVQTV